MNNILAKISLGILFISAPTFASISFTGTNRLNSTDKASVTFDRVGNVLTVTLDNAATGLGGQKILQQDLLQGIVFGRTKLNMAPNMVIATQGTVDPNKPPGYNVGSGWGFQHAPILNPIDFGAGWGTFRNYIGSAAFLAGDISNFNNGANKGTGNLLGNAAGSGASYGIGPNNKGVSDGFCDQTIATPNNCFIAKNEVVFTFSNVTNAEFADITTNPVVFLWGQSLNGNDSTPEPGFYGVLALGISGLFFFKRQKKQAVQL